MTLANSLEFTNYAQFSLINRTVPKTRVHENVVEPNFMRITLKQIPKSTLQGNFTFFALKKY